MASTPNIVFIFAVAFNFVRANVAFLGGQSGPNHLHPVHGLYVKPSSDGTTGDLYVAATEDSGVKTQWLTEQPINFLPQQLAYTSSLATGLPDEAVINNQKRAAITSPPVKYTYAMPVPTEGNVASAIHSAIPYPYSVPTATPKPAKEGSECSDVAATPAITPYYQYPFHLYYAQMMSAFANALNNVKDSGEEGTSGSSNTATAAPQASVWPYSYPVQYVMVDPSAWAKAQAATHVQPTTTPATNTEASNETS